MSKQSYIKQSVCVSKDIINTVMGENICKSYIYPENSNNYHNLTTEIK
jgi:hypothetical protein